MIYIYHIHKYSLSTISLALLNLSMFTEHIHLSIHIDTYCIRRDIHVCIRIGTLRRALSTLHSENTYYDNSNNYTTNNHNGGYGTSS